MWRSPPDRRKSVSDRPPPRFQPAISAPDGSIGASENFLGKIERSSESAQWGKLLQVLQGLGIQVVVDMSDTALERRINDLCKRMGREADALYAEIENENAQMTQRCSERPEFGSRIAGSRRDTQ